VTADGVVTSFRLSFSRYVCPVRYIALALLAALFLTGLVWWLVFIGNAVLHVIRRR
jgi:hypothetical protein